MKFLKKFFISLICSIVFLFVLAQPSSALIDPISVSAEAYMLVIFAGKVYAIGSKAVSASNAMAQRAATQSISNESQQTIQDFVDAMGDRADAAAGEAYGAATEEEARKALNKETQFREMQRKYTDLLKATRDNTNLVVRNIAIDEAKSQAAGYVTGLAKGEVGTWTVDTAVGAVGSELTTAGQDFTGVILNLSDGTMAGAEQFQNGLSGNIPTDISPEDAEFMQALMDVKSSSMEAAISKTEWDKFVKETAKQEFKNYLKGQRSNFESLPLSVQQRYWGKFLTMTPSDLDRVNRLMTGARYSNNYGYVLKTIMRDYPHYAEFFKNLNKDLLSQDADLKEEIENFLEELKISPTPSFEPTPSPIASPSVSSEKKTQTSSSYRSGQLGWQFIYYNLSLQWWFYFRILWG